MTKQISIIMANRFILMLPKNPSTEKLLQAYSFFCSLKKVKESAIMLQETVTLLRCHSGHEWIIQLPSVSHCCACHTYVFIAPCAVFIRCMVYHCTTVRCTRYTHMPSCARWSDTESRESRVFHVCAKFWFPSPQAWLILSPAFHGSLSRGGIMQIFTPAYFQI